MRKLLLIGVAFVLLGAVAGPAAANHSWANYHWSRSSNPVRLDIGSNLGVAYQANLALAIDDWDGTDNSGSAYLALTQVAGAGLRNCGAVAGRVEVCNDSYGFRGWLGVASIWASGDHITQATVKMNDSYLLGGGTYDSNAWRQMVLCQEVGHTFGLDHQDEVFDNPNLGTCMDYTNDPSTNQHPNAHDFAQLATIYTHLDGGSGGGGGGSCPPRKPGCSGNALSLSRASRANGSTYVDVLPGGVIRITHIFWVPRGR